MSAMTLTVAAAAAASAGFSSLSLAMDRHYEACAGRGRTIGQARPWLRVGGVAGLLAALVASLILRGPAQGWVLWCGVMTASAWLVVGLLAWRPRYVPFLGAGMALVAAVAFAAVVAV